MVGWLEGGGRGGGCSNEQRRGEGERGGHKPSHTGYDKRQVGMITYISMRVVCVGM